MKISIHRVFIIICLLNFTIVFNSSAQVAINSTGAAPNASAMLDISSTTKGLLIPSMTLVQRNSIVNPATGLMIFQTDAPSGFYYYNGNVWTQIGGNSSSSTSQWGTSGSNIYYNIGNVGIGTTTPSNKLEINSGTAGLSGTRLTQLTSGSIPFINSTKDIAQNNAQLFWDATNNRMGLGTATPGNKLEVNSGTAGLSGIRFTQLTTGSIPFISSTKDIAQNNTQLFWDAANSRMGIGTATPGNKLEVNSGTSGLSGVRFTQLTAGSIPFINSTKDIAQNNTQLFWDATNNRMGIGTATPSSTLQVNGSFSAKIVTVTGNYTATATDHTIIAKPTTRGITITLPSAASSTGRIYIIKRVSTRLVTIDPNGSEQIDGAKTYSISSNNFAATIQSDGVAWYVI